MKLLTFSILFAFLNCSFGAVSYDGYKVVRLYGEKGLVDINNLVDTYGLDIWSSTEKSIDILVSPGQYQNTVSLFTQHGFKDETIINDVQKLIDGQLQERKHLPSPLSAEKQLLLHRPSPNYFSFTDLIDLDIYHTLDEINFYLNEVSDLFPDLISVYSIGTSYEGRDINIVDINDPTADPDRPVVWIDCTTHAREWITPATCLYVLDYLVNGYQNGDADVLDLLLNNRFYMVPVLNPDGYEYTWTEDRMWRKNRSPNEDCFGVDLNRNFDDNFGGAGASPNPCFSTYHGPSAFSELETTAMSNFINGIGGANFKIMFNVHSYSQFWLTPYGYTNALAPENEEMVRVSQAGVDAMFAVNGFPYENGPFYSVLYVATGNSVDWGYAAGIVHSYLLELRDTGEYGFILPEDQIVPNASEVLAGMLAAINAL